MSAAAAPEASGGAVRIRIVERGMYRLTYADLLAAGVPLDADPPGVNPQSFTMAYLGDSIRIQVSGEADGRFDDGDLVIFYAEPYVGRYMTHNVYWLYYGAAAAPATARMLTRNTTATGAEPILTTITQTLHVEFDRIYPDNPNWPIPTDADHWFDSALNAHLPSPVAAVTYALALDDPLAAGQAQVRGLLYGGANQAPNPDQSVAVRLNGRAVRAEPYQWEGRTPYAFTATVPAAWLDQNPSQLTLEAALAQLPGLASYYVHPDWVEISYGALADAEGDRIYVEGLNTAVSASVALTVTGFTAPDVIAYDVRYPLTPTQITSIQAVFTDPSYDVQVIDAWGAADPPPSYVLTTQAALRVPLAVELDDITTWRTPDHEVDYIAIVHPSLESAVQPLLDYRAGPGGGFSVAKVLLQDIYDEFSFGRDYPPAIRDFLSYAFHYWNGGGGLPNPPAPPRYVLLVGDGHHDFKGDTTLPNLIPPYLIHIDPWIGETAADNRYASVDGPDDYLPDMAIGRIPARNADDVTAVVEKIIAYETQEVSPEDSWTRRVSYVAANNSDPAGDFHKLSDEARLNWLPTHFDSQTLYWKKDFTDGYQMRLATRQVFGNSVMVQWFGHASLYAWFVDNYDMFGTGSLPNMTDTTHWAFSAHYSCWTGYFINLHQNRQTLGELLVIYPRRGSIAALAPSGKHVGSALLTLEQGLTAAIFRDRIRTVGDAVNAAKLYYYTNTSAWHDVLDTSVLFGDPATRLRLSPEPPSPGITLDDGVAVLEWSHVLDSQRYQVWRGTTPYFDPDAGEGVQIATEEVGLRGAGTTLAVRDDGKTPAPEVTIIGDVDTNYFWVVRSQNGDGVSGVSNRVGEFDFRLTPGQ